MPQSGQSLYATDVTALQRSERAVRTRGPDPDTFSPGGDFRESAEDGLGVNTGGTDLPAYSACTIIGSYVAGVDAQWKRQFEIALPSSGDAGYFAVTAGKIASGYCGKIYLSGTCMVQIQTASGDLYADIVPGETYLNGDPSSGGSQILWEDGGPSASTHNALIRFPYAAASTPSSFSARVATTAAITQSGLGPIDGISLSDGDIILDRSNATASAQGLWVAHSGSWTRGPAVTSGALVSIREGTLWANSIWMMTVNNPIVIGSTGLDFVQCAVPLVVALAKGTGLTHSGTQTVDGVSCGVGAIVFDAPDVWMVQSGAWDQLYVTPQAVAVSGGTSNGPTLYVYNGSSYVAIAGVYT